MALFQISLIILIVISALYALSFWASPKKGDQEKLSSYETGFEPLGDARKKVSIIYWVIGQLYLIFDLELIKIQPFASIMHTMNSYIAIIAFMGFLIIQALGFVYEYMMEGIVIETRLKD